MSSRIVRKNLFSYNWCFLRYRLQTAKQAYKSKQARGLVGYCDLPGQDLEGRLEIAALKNFMVRNFLKRNLIASHLLKLHHHLKPVSHWGQKPLTWCAYWTSFSQTREKGSTSSRKDDPKQHHKIFKTYLFSFWFTSSSYLQAFTRSSNIPSFIAPTRRKGQINICHSSPCFWKLLCHQGVHWRRKNIRD